MAFVSAQVTNRTGVHVPNTESDRAGPDAPTEFSGSKVWPVSARSPLVMIRTTPSPAPVRRTTRAPEQPQRHTGAGTGDPLSGPLQGRPAMACSPEDLGVKPLRRPGNLPARTRQLTSQACRRDISTVHERSSSRRRRMFGTGAMALSLGLGLCAGQLVAPQVANATPVVSAVAAARSAPKMSQSVNRRALKKGQLGHADRQDRRPEDRQGRHLRPGPAPGLPQGLEGLADQERQGRQGRLRQQAGGHGVLPLQVPRNHRRARRASPTRSR